MMGLSEISVHYVDTRKFYNFFSTNIFIDNFTKILPIH